MREIRGISWGVCAFASLVFVSCNPKGAAPAAEGKSQAANAQEPAAGAKPAAKQGAMAGHPPGAGSAHGQAHPSVHGQAHPSVHGQAHPSVHGQGHAPAKGAAPVAATPGILQVEGLQGTIPTSWVAERPGNAMRKAQYKIADKKHGDASFVVYRFPGGAGAAKQNMDRWIGQFAPQAAKSAKTTTQTKGPLKIHALEVQGDYQARAMPGQDPKSVPRGNQRLLAAVIEGHGDSIYFKILGPVDTVTAQQEAWKGLLDSLVVKP